jgi:H+/gluconate symporter-like permease
MTPDPLPVYARILVGFFAMPIMAFVAIFCFGLVAKLCRKIKEHLSPPPTEAFVREREERKAEFWRRLEPILLPIWPLVTLAFWAYIVYALVMKFCYGVNIIH